MDPPLTDTFNYQIFVSFFFKKKKKKKVRKTYDGHNENRPSGFYLCGFSAVTRLNRYLNKWRRFGTLKSTALCYLYVTIANLYIFYLSLIYLPYLYSIFFFLNE